MSVIDSSSASMGHPVSFRPLSGRDTLFFLYLAVAIDAIEAWCMMRSGPAIETSAKYPAQRSLVLMCLGEILT